MTRRFSSATSREGSRLPCVAAPSSRTSWRCTRTRWSSRSLPTLLRPASPCGTPTVMLRDTRGSTSGSFLHWDAWACRSMPSPRLTPLCLLHSHSYDHCFGPQASQKELYDTVAGPIVQDVLRGINGTVLAYGQTGTGKTYTMGILDRIDDQHAGIIPRSLSHIFGHVSSPVGRAGRFGVRREGQGEERGRERNDTVLNRPTNMRPTQPPPPQTLENGQSAFRFSKSTSNRSKTSLRSPGKEGRKPRRFSALQLGPIFRFARIREKAFTSRACESTLSQTTPRPSSFSTLDSRTGPWPRR